MGISSDVYITRKKAEEMVKNILLDQHKILLESALKNMENWDLTSHLNEEGGMYYYNIENEELEATRFEVIDHTTGGEGRILVKTNVDIETSFQDDGKTMKVFLEDAE